MCRDEFNVIFMGIAFRKSGVFHIEQPTTWRSIPLKVSMCDETMKKEYKLNLFKTNFIILDIT